MTWVLTGLVALALAGEPPPEGAAEAAARTVLRDQLGGSDSLAAHEGQPQVVFVVSARRLRRQKAWEVELDRRLEGVGFLRVADVPAEGSSVPPSYEEIASTLRKRVPQPVRVLVDTERRWALGLGLDTREVNALAFDAHGREVARARGPARPDSVGAIEKALLALPGVRRKAAPQGHAGARP